jgi:hypothetical protein
MNKRIIELAERAAHDTREKHDNAYWWFQDELAEESIWRERFAELIVRECAELAGCNIHVSGFALGDLMKEHFGIKE